MQFRIWLEEQWKPNIRFYFKGGAVTVHIDDRRYVYSMNSDDCRRWQRMLHADHPGVKWDVLNQIKQYVKKGFGEQLYPLPVPKINPPPPHTPAFQKTLF